MPGTRSPLPFWHDGREYLLKLIEWNEFRLYTTEGRTVMTMFMDRVDSLVTKMDMRFEKVRTEEKDYLLLATLTFWEVVFFNRQTS